MLTSLARVHLGSMTQQLGSGLVAVQPQVITQLLGILARHLVHFPALAVEHKGGAEAYALHTTCSSCTVHNHVPMYGF